MCIKFNSLVTSFPAYLVKLYLIIFIVVQSFTNAMGQNVSMTNNGLLAEDYNQIKTFALSALEEDTSIVTKNYTLKREKPPYLFEFSDGIERRVYLFDLLDNKTDIKLGKLAVYHIPINVKTINLYIPEASAAKEMWDRYNNDLNEYAEKESGFLSTVNYVLSQEMSWLMAKENDQSSESADAENDIQAFLPATSMVTMADGTEKRIDQVQSGDLLLAYDLLMTNKTVTSVTDFQVQHHIQPVSSVMLILDDLAASLQASSGTVGITLQATSNYPVLTDTGRKEIGQLQEGDKVYCYDEVTGRFHLFSVYNVSKNEYLADKFYSLTTDQQNYFANGAVVLDK